MSIRTFSYGPTWPGRCEAYLRLLPRLRLAIVIQVFGRPAYIRLYSPLVRGATETPQLDAHLNELNSALGHMHFYVREGTIFAISEVPASPLRYEHLATALTRFSDIADGMDDLLEAEFGEQGKHSKHTLIN